MRLYTPPAPAATGAGNGLLNNLVAFWEFEESSGTRNDSKGANHLTTITGTLTRVSGMHGGYAMHMASGAEVSRADTADLSIGNTDSFTITFWVKPATGSIADGNDNYIVAKDSGSAGSYNVVLKTNYRLSFLIFSSNWGAVDVANTANNSIVENAWQFCACWFDAAAGKIYAQVNNGTIAEATKAATYTDNSDLFILGSASADFGFVGDLDDMGFWRRALSADDRTALYNAGAGLPYASFTT